MEFDRVIGFSTGKIVFRDNQQVAKVFDQEYSKAAVLCEAMNQACVEETDLNVPKVLEVLPIQGKWSIISQYIAGDTLEYLMRKNPEKTEEYIEMMVELQLQMHEYRMPLLNKMSKLLGVRLRSSELSSVMQYILMDKLKQFDRGEALCHGNFHPKNIILDKQGKLFVLNFSETSTGNPNGDAAKTALLLLESHGEELAKQYTKCYCEKTNLSADNINLWLPILAGAHLATAKEWIRPILLEFLQNKEKEI